MELRSLKPVAQKADTQRKFSLKKTPMASTKAKITDWLEQTLFKL